MDNDSSDLREALWRRKLSAAERAKLGSQPDLELETRLTDAVSRLRDVPVASNFTSRVLAAVDLEERQAARGPVRRFRGWRSLFPRFAAAATVLIVAGVSLRHYEITSQRYALAKNVAMATTSQPVPSVDALENLDAIQRMSQSSHADGELLADLQ